MIRPTVSEAAHYQRLVGRQIRGILWDEINGQPVPILVLDTKKGKKEDLVSVLADPEGNGPGHLSHDL